MIQQTIYSRVSSHIPAISLSYRFNGGVATIQLDSYGNYEVLVNGSRFSALENTAKRDSAYKATVAEVTTRMIAAFEKRDSSFVGMHRNAEKIQLLSDHQKRIDDLAPYKYVRESFGMSRPMRDEVRKELQQEAAVLFADLFEDKTAERNAYVKEHEKEAMALRLRGYEELQAFFAEIQDDKEARANAVFQKDYERQRKEIEDFINGEMHLTEEGLRTILSGINLPFKIDISCDYVDKNGLLTVEIVLPADLNVPATKANILSSGKISVKDKLVKEAEQLKTEAIVSLVYYIAASLFNAAINIQTQRVSVLTNGKRDGLLWIQFDRNRFSQLSMRTVNLMVDYCDWPRMDALRMVRGAYQFDEIAAVDFKNEIAQAIIDYTIVDAQEEQKSSQGQNDAWHVTLGYAQILADALPNDTELQRIVSEAIRAQSSKVNLPKKYKGMFNELKK